MTRRLLRRSLWSLPLLLLASACASNGGAFASLSITSDADATLDVGDSLRWSVRAIARDGASSDVTSRAECQLSAAGVGRLEEGSFIAEAPGNTELECTYQSLSSRLSIMVRGDREITIAELQSGAVSVGSRVRLEAIVTAVDASETRTDGWAQDAGGGPRSGIALRDRRAEEGELPLSEGDRVVVTGVFERRNGRNLVAFESLDVLGTGELTFDDVAITEIADPSWAGALVSVSGELQVSREDVDGFAWEVTDVDERTLLVDDYLYDADRAEGERIERLSGVVFPFDDGTETWTSIVVRGPTDVQRGVRETVDVTLPELRTLPLGTRVRFEALVTAVDVSGDRDDLMVQDPEAPEVGAYLRDVRDAPGVVERGARVRVEGTLDERRGRRVVEYDALERLGEDSPRAHPVTGATPLRDHEHALVRVLDVVVSNPSVDEYRFEVTDAVGALLVDDFFHDAAGSEGERFAAITGVVFCDAEGCGIAPRDADDVGAVAIRDLSQVSDGAFAQLREVVVTAVAPDGDALDFYAQDPSGGSGAGLYFADDRIERAPLSLAIGDVVRVRGVHERLERGYRSLAFDEVSPASRRADPIVSDVAPEDLDGRWYGGLVRLTGLTITGALSYGFEVEGPTYRVVVADELTSWPERAVGERVDVVGVVYVTRSGTLELWPRTSDDVGAAR